MQRGNLPATPQLRNSAGQRIGIRGGALGALCTWPSGHTILGEFGGPKPAADRAYGNKDPSDFAT